MRTYTQKRTAKDPQDYVRKLNASHPYLEARVVSIDGETKSGQKRYTMEIVEKISPRDYYANH